MKAEAALELAKKLRAEGVKRVELDGDEVKALDFHEPPPGGFGGGGDSDANQGSLDDDLDPEKDPSTSPFVAAVKQVQTGRYERREPVPLPKGEA